MFSVLALASGVAAEASLELAWYPNEDETTAGYKVHYGTASGSYEHSLDVGAECQAWIPDLTAGATYFFSVTAYGPSGEESPFSAELTVVPRAKSLPEGSRPARLTRFVRSSGERLDFDLDRGAAVDEVLVYGSDDLKHWKFVCRLPAVSTAFQLRDPDAAGASRRFYRLVSRFEP